MSGENERGIGSCGRRLAGRGSAWTPDVGLRGEGGREDGISCVWFVVGCEVVRGERRGAVWVTFSYFLF